MAFYYHFKDIYDLVEWSCYEDAKRALQGKKTYDTWQEGIRQIFEVVYENKPFIMNAYHAISREQIENYWFKLTYSLMTVSYTHLDVYKRQVLVESIFVIPGLGNLMITSIKSKDFMVVENGVLIIAVAVALCNLIVDILLSLIHI